MLGHTVSNGMALLVGTVWGYAAFTGQCCGSDVTEAKQVYFYWEPCSSLGAMTGKDGGAVRISYAS